MRFRKYISEGGHAIKDVVRLNVENYDATKKDLFKRVLPLLNLNPSDVVLLGSGGKKKAGQSYGDIDMGVSIPQLVKNNKGLTTENIEKFIYDKVKKLSTGIKASKGFGLVSIDWPITNTDGKQPDSFVQVDLMLTDDLDWTGFYFFSPSSYESKFSGKYRGILISTISSIVKRNILKYIKDDPLEWEQLSLSNVGLRKVTKSLKGKKGTLTNPKVIEKRFISKSPEEIIELVFGPNINRNELNSFESIYKLITSKKFRFRDKNKEIFTAYVKVLKKLGLLVPKELEKYA